MDQKQRKVLYPKIYSPFLGRCSVFYILITFRTYKIAEVLVLHPGSLIIFMIDIPPEGTS